MRSMFACFTFPVCQDHHHPEQQLGQEAVETEPLSTEPGPSEGCEDQGGDQQEEAAHSVQVQQVQC